MRKAWAGGPEAGGQAYCDKGGCFDTFGNYYPYDVPEQQMQQQDDGFFEQVQDVAQDAIIQQLQQRTEEQVQTIQDQYENNMLSEQEVQERIEEALSEFKKEYKEEIAQNPSGINAKFKDTVIYLGDTWGWQWIIIILLIGLIGRKQVASFIKDPKGFFLRDKSDGSKK